ncbi:MAG: SGNH/GDSL hydrolase family protein [Planctomycetota bacterium]|jgi:lysophospholipase L1-like esterase
MSFQMSHYRILTCFFLTLAATVSVSFGFPQENRTQTPRLRSYEYEPKPDGDEFRVFNPAKAQNPSGLILKKGDRLAIVGDSITEQKMYSRIIETYLTACLPDLEITVRQYGWSGETAAGFLRRMDKDCLTFEPTIATICYGMNDAKYRPFDVTNGNWYRDNYTAIVDRFQEKNVRVIVGSPGCSGKIASWVNPKSGTLQEHNLHLCALRDIALEIAAQKKTPFADIFWPMYQQQILAPKQFMKSAEEYAVAGKDGIHPGWAGQVIMAFAFLKAMGLDGNLGTIHVDMKNGTASADGKHEIKAYSDGVVTVVSSQYPYCANGPIDDDNSIRSGMSLIPFSESLNRFLLKVVGTNGKQVRVTWGDSVQVFSSDEAAQGIRLADRFEKNPFSPYFDKIDAAVLAKQTYETKQVKQIFHGEAGNKDFAKAVEDTEAERKPLADAIRQAIVPVEHQIKIELIDR